VDTNLEKVVNLGKKVKSISNQGTNIAALKRQNQSLVLSIIKEYGPISRVAIARETGLTKSAISKVVGNLIRVGLVEEAGTDDTFVGRKPVTLRLSTNNYFVVGVGVGRAKISVGIANLEGNIIARKATSLRKDDTQGIILRKIVNLIYQITKYSNVEMKKIIGIGIGSPGPLYAHSGIILSPPNFPGWHDVPLKKLIREEFKIPVFIDNDANVAALAEKWFGNGKGIDNFIFLLLDVGIGAGIAGKRCECGNYGCLENFASCFAIVSKVKNLISSGRETIITKMVKGRVENIEIEMIIEAARKRDALSLQILREAARYLSIGIANLVNLFNIKTIILGGRLMGAGEILLDPVRKMVKKRVYLVTGKNLQIIPSYFGEEIHVVGACALALSYLFKDLGLIKERLTVKM